MSEPSAASDGYRVIGSVDDFTSFPASVTLDRDPYFIIRTEASESAPAVYRLVSAICPHAGGVVRPMENELVCPLHYWSFDAHTGESTNVPGEQLECRPLEVRDGQFVLAT